MSAERGGQGWFHQAARAGCQSRPQVMSMYFLVNVCNSGQCMEFIGQRVQQK
jgi:hypothetical protein